MTACPKRCFFCLTILLFIVQLLARESSGEGEKERHEPPMTTAGLFYGYLIQVDPNRAHVVVHPADERLPRKKFIIDRQTLFRFHGKRANYDQLQPGQKVAVRFFAEGALAIAEEIFVVVGEFVPHQYRERKKRAVGAAPKASGGSH